MMSSNPVVAAKRHTDPANFKPLTTRSRQTLQRSVSQGNQSSAAISSSHSQAPSSIQRDYSRASSAASVRTTGTNRSTASTRSLSKEQVRDRMQRPPDIPTCRGGSINVYRCSAEYLEDFWSKQKAENDARRLAIKKSQEEHRKLMEAEAARSQSASTRAKPVLSASVASRTAALKPPPKKTPTAGPSTSQTASRTASRGQASETLSRPASSSARPASAGPANPQQRSQQRALRTPSATSTPITPTRISPGSRSSTITGKPIGVAPRSVSASKKAIPPSSTSNSSVVSRTSSATRVAPAASTTAPAVRSQSAPKKSSVGGAVANSTCSNSARGVVKSVGVTRAPSATALKTPTKPAVTVAAGSKTSKPVSAPSSTRKPASTPTKGKSASSTSATPKRVATPVSAPAAAERVLAEVSQSAEGGDKAPQGHGDLEVEGAVEVSKTEHSAAEIATDEIADDNWLS